jgi:hypothetical protein
MKLKVIIQKQAKLYVLFVYHPALGTMLPAGPRLKRGKPLPIDGFEYLNSTNAKVAAEKLQAYIDYCHEDEVTDAKYNRQQEIQDKLHAWENLK